MSKNSTQSSSQYRWLTVSYQPVSLFSLKRSDATNMAGRSNLVPTPYCIKMALLKVLIESEGGENVNHFETWIKPEFNWLRDLKIYLEPPEYLVVNRNSYKLRYYDQTADKADKTRPTVPMQDGFVFREWVYFQGKLRICCGETERLTDLERLFSRINYFGKRGCFFQYLPDETQYTETPQIQLDPSQGFIVQPMDDLGEKTTFEKISTYSSKSAKLGKDRIIHSGFLPLKLIATTANYDFYQRC